MPGDFQFDVFLSHSSQDKSIVRDLARRLTEGGLRVWFDESQIRPGDSIPAKIEDGLENSRILILCMSTAAFGSDWTQLESHTFRFRDLRSKTPSLDDDIPRSDKPQEFRVEVTEVKSLSLHTHSKSPPLH